MNSDSDQPGRKRVLLAGSIREDALTLLRDDFFIYSTDEGEKVLSMIYNEPPDLILLDADLKDQRTS